MSDKELQKSTKQEPQFISNTPCNEDLFEGKSHSKIANSISDLLIENRNCNIVGIDGGWGSGKSNLVKLVESNIKTKNKYFHFFVYDAWGFQNDYQKRSILETLTSYLIEEKIISGSKWNSMLMQLLSKKSSVGLKVVKELNPITKVSAIFAFLLPVFNFIYSKIPDFKYKNYLWFIPVLLFIITLVIVQIRNMIKYGQDISFSSFFKDLFYSYLDYTDNTQNVEEAIKYETIYEEEASTRDFKNWMQKIDSDLKNERLVIVFDNMDRLPSEKVQELWAAINSIFADIQYKSISVLVPFDRKHIRNAFKSEDIDDQEKSYGDDFINKTFNVVFRVSPPTMSNWKKYFEIKWDEAFNEKPDYAVIQIYDLLTDTITPRKIIAFINEFVSLRILFDKETVPDKYIALFIFGRNSISDNPDKEIIDPSYLKSLDFMYKEDDNLPKYTASLYYQLNPQNAIEIIFEKKIITALDNNDCNTLKEINKLPTFNLILQSAITKVTNYANAIVTLNACLDDDYSDEQYIWDAIYRKVSGKESKLQDYQAILLEKITNKEEYLTRILNDFANTEKFNVTDYYESLNYLYENIEGLDVDLYFEMKEVSPEDYLSFLLLAQKDYEIYKIKCELLTLDNYLKELKIEQLQKETGLIYTNLTPENLPLYMENLRTKINNNYNNKSSISYLFERLKEIEDPVSVKLPDVNIFNLLQNSTPSEDFYYDLISMIIARLNSFQYRNTQLINNIMNNTDNNFVCKISEKIGYYITNSDLLINIEEMKQSPLYLEICKEIIINNYKPQRADINKLVQSYKYCKEYLKINPQCIFSFMNRWIEFKNKITIEKIKEIPIEYFEDGLVIKDDLYKHCHKTAVNYLSQISVDNWKEYIEKTSYEYQLLITLNQKNENCYEAFKVLMLDKAKGNSTISKKKAQTLISVALKNKRSLKNLFDNIRDLFCSGNCDMDISMFDFFGDWLFQYSDLSKKEDALRRILPTNLLDNEDVSSVVIKNKEMTKKMITCSPDPQDFIGKIKSLAETKYSGHEEFINFVKFLGITIESKEEDSE